MNISEITIGARVRQDMGDLPALAESIRAEGLLHPIGVTEDKVLVFGERRLKACRDLLGWTDIPARVVNVTSIVAGEYAENTVRKDFTPSERVAIAEAVRRELGNRQGRRTGPVGERPQALTGRKSREIAAERAGFGSARNLSRATWIVRRGVPELVEAMDHGEVSVHAAAAVADLPPAEQQEVLTQGRAIDVARERHGTRSRGRNPMSRRAQYKHPVIKLENIASMLETISDAWTSLDVERAAEENERLRVCLKRIGRSLRAIRRSFTKLTRRIDPASAPASRATPTSRDGTDAGPLAG